LGLVDRIAGAMIAATAQLPFLTQKSEPKTAGYQLIAKNT
jgi:hypothetical protein